MTFQEFARKKVIGVPVIYLAGAFVVILAVVAWKMKPTTADTTTEDAGDTTGGSAADNAIDPSDYSGLATQGTVTVVQSPPTDTPNSSITTNQQWVSQGVQWLVAQNKTDGATALDALNKFVNGEDYTFDQKTLVNLVIAELGPPPDGAGGGTSGSAPAKTQGTPPTTHTVTGNSDQSLQDLATLYYGSNSLGEKMDLIQGNKANASIGDGPYPVGTKVYIPVYSTPKYYTTPSANMTRAQVASKNGITEAQLVIYNNGPQFNSRQTFPKGYKLRVG